MQQEVGFLAVDIRIWGICTVWELIVSYPPIRVYIPADKPRDLSDLLQATIVTADGTHRTTNRCSNSDLYWALRGGGGSTWGVGAFEVTQA